jgi:hypothetical protein
MRRASRVPHAAAVDAVARRLCARRLFGMPPRAPPTLARVLFDGNYGWWGKPPRHMVWGGGVGAAAAALAANVACDERTDAVARFDATVASAACGWVAGCYWFLAAPIAAAALVARASRRVPRGDSRASDAPNSA